jgi:hypothetical protein
MMGTDRNSGKGALYGLTFKALLIGVGAILFLTWIEIKAYLYKRSVSLDLISAPSIGAMFIIVALMLVNLLYRRVRGKSFIAEYELIMIYIMTSFAGTIVAYPYYLNALFPRLVSYAQITLMFSSRYPQVTGRMSNLLVPVDMNAVNNFLRGGSQVPWSLWIIPMVMWFLFFSAFFLLQLSIATMIRKRWTEIEHLSYPLTLPIYSMMAEEEGKGYVFWKDRLVWLGAIIPIVIYSLTSLHKYFPVLPEVNLMYDLKKHFIDEPWKTVAETTLMALDLNPLYVGIAYLLPLDLLFSFWFFRWVHYIQFAILASLLPFNVFFNWTGQPSEFIAGLSVVALVHLWMARGDFVYIIKRGISKEHDPRFNESNEPLSYKTAFWLFVICFVFLTYFYGVLMDGSIWFSIMVLLSFCVTAFAWARVRTEAGLPQTQAGTWFNTVAVTQSSGRYHEAVLLAGLGEYVVDYGAIGCQAGIALEYYMLGDKSNVSRKSVTKAMLISYTIAVILFLPLALKAYYSQGAYSINRGLVAFPHMTIIKPILILEEAHQTQPVM